MIWVGWRRQRTETLIAAAIIALLAALLVPTGIQMSGAFHHDGLAACLGHQTSSSCDDAIHSFENRFSSLGNLLAWLTLVPGLVGVLLAAPFVLEFEQGTYRLALTQSVSRRRWIAGKLALAVGASLAAALVLTLLVTWWREPLVRLDGRMDASVYDSEGLVVFGYTLFALGLAIAVGVLWRRAVPALVVGFAGYFATRIFVDTWLRQRLMAPLSRSWPFSGADPPALRHAWVLNQYPSDAAGHPVGLPVGICNARGIIDKASLSDCLARHGFSMHAVYEPASRFWPLQLRETALYAVAAIVLLAFSAWWTNRRTA